MKKTNLLLALSAMFALGLVGCKEQSEAPASSEPTSEVTSSEPAVVYTAEGVMQDITTALFGTAVLGEDYFSDGADGFYTGVSFGEYGEEYLELAVETAAEDLPEYCVEVSAPAEGTWDEGDAGYFATYATEDGSISIQLGSYVYNSQLCCQINVYPAE